MSCETRRLTNPESTGAAPLAGAGLAASAPGTSARPVTEAKELSEALPKGRLQVIAEAGHTSPLECPEVFGDAVAAFLRELA